MRGLPWLRDPLQVLLIYLSPSSSRYVHHHRAAGEIPVDSADQGYELVGVTLIEEKLIQHQLRRFGHIQRRPSEALVRRRVLERTNNVKRGWDRPKMTCDEAVKERS